MDAVVSLGAASKVEEDERVPITQELFRLGQSARRLNDGSDRLNRLIATIDRLLERLMIGLDYIHPRPLSETATTDHAGKRVIELAYVGYLNVEGAYHLAVKTVKVFESRLAQATESPGAVTPLMKAPRRLRYAAVDLLPELVAGLAEQVEDVVGAMERRCRTAQALVEHLEEIAGPIADAEVEQAAQSATSHRRPTRIGR